MSDGGADGVNDADREVTLTLGGGTGSLEQLVERGLVAAEGASTQELLLIGHLSTAERGKIGG